MTITGMPDAEAEDSAAQVSATLSDAELEDITGGAAPHTVCCGSDCVQ